MQFRIVLLLWADLLPSPFKRSNWKRACLVTHEVTNMGSDRSQLASAAKDAKAALHTEKLDPVADRGYFNGEEILACEQAGITVTLPKPMTSGVSFSG
jgi:hypothetical protein